MLSIKNVTSVHLRLIGSISSLCRLLDDCKEDFFIYFKICYLWSWQRCANSYISTSIIITITIIVVVISIIINKLFRWYPRIIPLSFILITAAADILAHFHSINKNDNGKLIFLIAHNRFTRFPNCDCCQKVCSDCSISCAILKHNNRWRSLSFTMTQITFNVMSQIHSKVSICV